MKKLLQASMICMALTALLSISAFAADTDYGIMDFTPDEDVVGITATLKNAGGNSVTPVQRVDSSQASHDFAPGAVRFALTYVDQSITADKQYLVMVLNDNAAAPTQDNIVYIDQTTSKAGSVEFANVYPILTTGKTYHMYLSSNDTGASVTSFTEVASFTYSRDPSNPWSLGDVTRDGRVNSSDALIVLQATVGNVALDEEQQVLANVNHDARINSSDALMILQATVGNITLE